METVTKSAWEAAVLRLLEDVNVFVATGPRAHSDWRGDVLAVMNRDVDDPRGWRTLDWDKENEERTSSRPSFPFLPLSREALAECLYPVTSETAARLLVTMTYEWGPPEPEDKTAGALTDARILLDRYGEDISCYSNITKARTSPSPDLTAGVTGWKPVTQYDGDYGVVVVSPDEVGVFWSFNPI